MSDNARIIVLRTMAEIAAQMAQQGDWQTEEIADEARALAKRLSDEAQAIEAPPTPEKVLRAMLIAYESDLMNMEVALQRFVSPWPFDVSSSQRHADVSTLRTLTARVVAGDAYAISDWTHYRYPRRVFSDYEARLSGARSLDAPPLEAT